jgi:nucleoside-diphosphate kinase
MEKTLFIIKPDGVRDRLIGKVLAHIEAAGFGILACRMVRLTRGEAAEFYAVHKKLPFYPDLLEFMTSGPVVVVLLERENAVDHLRQVIGATDPKEAAAGTIRKLYATDKQYNVVHASDSPENAEREIGFFISESEWINLWGGI